MNILRRNRLSNICFKCSLLIAIGYIIAIHPATSIFGGIVFLLLGWIIPSIFNIVFSIALASSINTKKIFQFLAFFPISFATGINSNFIYFIDNNKSCISFEEKIGNKIIISDNDYVKFKISGINKLTVNGNIAIFPSNYFISSFVVGGDEGCGCMYFLQRASFYDKRLNNLFYEINNHNSKENNSENRYQVLVNTDIINRFLGNLSIEIYHGLELCSSLHIHNIPYKDIQNRYGREKRLLNGYFASNTIDMLLHNNFWCFAVGLLPKYNLYSYGDLIQNFISESIVIQKSR